MRYANNADGYEFYPVRSYSKTHDAASIGEHAKHRVALSPDALKKITAAMVDIGARIERLEAKRRAPQLMPPKPTPQSLRTVDAKRCACGRAPFCICGDGHLAATPHPVPIPPRVHMEDNATPRHVALAPLRHVTFDKPLRKTRDQTPITTFGERSSRFSSQEAARIARHIVGAGPPTAAELNEAYHKAWAGSGASGQMHDDTA